MNKSCNIIDHISEQPDSLLNDILCQINNQLKENDNIILKIVKRKIEFVMQNRCENSPLE